MCLRNAKPSVAKISALGAISRQMAVAAAIPLTAGPSALAMVLLFVAKQPERIWTWAASILIASVVFLTIVLCGNYLMRFLGKRGLIAIERLMGMILTTVAVQMFLTGVSEYLHVT